MVDEREILKQYSYKATSNLVIEQENRRNKDRDAAGVSALQSGSLRGRMGDRINRPGDKSVDLQKRIQKLKERTEANVSRTTHLNDDGLGVANDTLAPTAETDVVQVAEDLEIDEAGATYIPSTAVSQRAYQALMAFITSKLGDQPQDLLRGAADETLSLLKDDLLMELDRKKNIETTLGNMDGDEFSRLSMLGRQITDYGSIGSGKEDGDGEDDTPIEDVGVAVMYDADEDGDGGDEDSDDAVGEVVDVDELDADENEQTHDANSGDGGNTGQYDPVKSDANENDPSQVNPRKVDAYWVQRKLVQYYPEPVECQRIAEAVLTILSSNDDERACENRLVSLLEFDKFDLLAIFLENRLAIVWGTRFARSETADDTAKLRSEMEKDERSRSMLEVLFPDYAEGSKRTSEKDRKKGSIDENRMEIDEEKRRDSKHGIHPFGRRKPKFPLRTIDLEGLAFQKGGRSTAVRQCKLPDGSEHIESKDYEEWHIPATTARDNNANATISISDLPKWSQSAFPGTRQLNRVQSSAYPCAFESNENMLLCAPTGAGKTNVAMLTILRAVQNVMSHEEHLLSSGNANLSSLKVVYVAPMKALVAEVVENLGRRLSSLGMVVKELTGDVSLSRRDVDKTHVIVTTPEKWDIITRKSAEKSFTRLVKLLIVDEIHLLHDERGPVLEAIIARTLREAESVANATRVVGLSATLPNYKDVAAFLRVNPSSGLFYFGAEHRPCPLQQCYVGITSKKALKRFQLMNEVTYEKVMAQLDMSNQTIIFVHSRKETAATGQYLIDKAINDEVIDKFLKPKSDVFELIQSELPTVSGKDLSVLLEHGIAIHHAGMTRGDRELVERLYNERHIKVLISTATLAWGVNLPAHAVIIKGTQVYSPEHGRWTQLSSMDVMQMMGRAGRPQYDTFGEGTIITSKSDVLYYLSLLNNQLPIESQVVSRIVDMLNAEVANGSISSIIEGSHWLSFTYLFVRMLKNPILYGIPVEEREADSTLERRRAELIHSAAMELHNSGLIRYNKKSGELIGTDVGKVSADFYVSHQSMALYIERMKECNSDIDLLRIFSSSGEFKFMRVRDEEKLELSRLSERVPIPIKESLDEPTAKVNVLLQAFISNLSLDGLALRSDMVYVTQSAARLARALLHIALQMKNAALFERCLILSKCVSARQWSSQSPLRQFQRKLGREVVRKIERKDYPFERYYDLNVSELGELLKNAKLGRTVHRLVHSLPRLEMDARVRPLSRTTVEVELTLLPDFRYDYSVHSGGETFWITVEDADSEHLLHVEPFFLKGSLANAEHFLEFTLHLTTPLPPQYFIRCISDRWIVPETVLPISYRGLVLPEKFAAHTKILDAEPMSVKKAFNSWLRPSDQEDEEDEFSMAKREVIADASSYFASRGSNFSAVQSQVFPSIFESDEPAVIATLPDIERDICVELALVRLFSHNPTAVAIWILGKGITAIEHKLQFVKEGIARSLNLKVSTFLSDRNEDLSVLRASGSLILTTPEKWDMFSRRRTEKRIVKIMKKIGLIVLDDIHLLTEISGNGAAYEVVSSRLRYITADAKENNKPSFRIIALSNPIANAREIGHWLGCPPNNVFSFHPRDICRELRLEVLSGSFRGGLRDSRAVMLSKPVYTTIRKHIGDKKHQVLVYVSNRMVANGLALEMLSIISETTNLEIFSADEYVSSQVSRLNNAGLRECVSTGVGFIHERLSDSDKAIVTNLFQLKKLPILIATARSAWYSRGFDCPLVIIAGTECDDEGGALTRRREYTRTDLMKMMFGMRDVSSPVSGKRLTVILTEAVTKEYYKTQFLEPFAVESQLPLWIADHLNAEIASRVIESKQDAVDYLTWTFFYRRLPKNANYYGMKGVSHIDISNHLSELVERSLSDLEASKCVAAVGEDDSALGPLNLGIIASHYYLRHATVELFSSSISASTNLKRVLDIVSLAAEFDHVAVRNGDEEEILQEMGARARIGLEGGGGPVSYSSTHAKVHLLLQAHMNRESLSGSLAEDQKEVVKTSVELLTAMVDVILSGGWLKPAIAAIELCQMLIQAVWDSDSSLMQLAHIDRNRAALLKDSFEVSDIFAFVDMEDADRNEALKGLSENQVTEIATACQQFPFIDDIEVVEVSELIEQDEDRDADGEGVRTTRVVVSVQRTEEDEDEKDKNEEIGKGKVPLVIAPRFMERREEGWWIIVGDEMSNTVFTVKHFALKQDPLVKLKFASPTRLGKHNLKIYLMSDSYIDCDQEESFEIVIGAKANDNDNGNDNESEKTVGGRDAGDVAKVGDSAGVDEIQGTE